MSSTKPPRYFRVEAGISYTVAASSQVDALACWAAYYASLGYETFDEDCGPMPELVVEIPTDEVARLNFDDGGVRKPLTMLERGGVISEEF